MRKLELLAPAKNLEIGIAAIDHGADAVYIGANRFGARQAAGNSLEDIKKLCDYAHRFGVSVHVTVNTIIYEKEFEDTLKMVEQLAAIGVDALLIQDMGLLNAIRNLPDYQSGKIKCALHASTQCDTRTAEKVGWLSSLGFDRVVLARELSIDEISNIHRQYPDVELEAFVHGALCVSYSGVCYASQHCFNRSANRGECAQFCRLKFDLRDDNSKLIEHQRHMLSLKDMCQIQHLEELADSGACAFKIEGRLKDINYVKNVVSAYSKALDELIARRPNDYCRASKGKVTYYFEPDLKKIFNRGYTTYFMNGRQPDIASFDTPKAMGEYVGRVKELRGNSFNVAGSASFSNGDGLCFINDEHELEGFRVNKAIGNRLFPLRMPEHLRPGLGLYRNNDEAFEKLMSGKTAERKISVGMRLSAIDGGFQLEIYSLTSEGKLDKVIGRAITEFEHQEAKRPQRENMIRNLTKLGNTHLVCDYVEIDKNAENCFIPSSLLSDMRRDAIENMENPDTEIRRHSLDAQSGKGGNVTFWQPEYEQYPYLYNISNSNAKVFYREHGMKEPTDAFEVKPVTQPLIMQCRHCIRYSLGYCVKRGGMKPTWKEPLHLELPDGRRFQLHFVCKECQMNITAE
jgi:putative protease